jgi:ATP-dependent DNA helicase DinG
MNTLIDEERMPLAGDVLQARGAAFGLKHNPVQCAYANYLSMGITEACDKNASGQLMVEADTGVGKTIAYLVALGLRCVLNGERAVVSTYTISLQRQILEHDAQRAFSIVEAETGKRPTIAVAVGMSNYVDVARLEATVLGKLDWCLDEGERAELNQMLEWSRGHHGGRIEQMLADLGLDALPASIWQDDVCLDSLSAEESPSYMAYQADRRAQQKADIVVVNHALLAAMAGRYWREGNAFADADRRPFSVLLIDEADRMRQACMGAGGNALPIERVKGALQNLGEVGVQTSLCDEAAGLLDDLRISMHPLIELSTTVQASAGESILMWDELHATDQAGVVESTKRLYQAMKRIGESKVLQDGSQTARLVRAVHGYAQRLARVLNYMAWRPNVEGFVWGPDAGGTAGSRLSSNSNTMLAIRWSPTRNEPSFLLMYVYPERILKSLWSARTKLSVKPAEGDAASDAAGMICGDNESAVAMTLLPAFKCLVLTSATLSDIDQMSMYQMKESYNIYDPMNPIADFMKNGANIFSPKHYGRTRIVFSSARAQRPFSDDDVFNHESQRVTKAINPVWVHYTVRACVYASEEGGRCLVLTTSYRTNAVIAEALRNAGLKVIEQRRGESQDACIAELARHPDSLLVSPRAWEGLDLGMWHEADGSRVPIKHVVMSQIPYAPKDGPHNHAIQVRLFQRGKSADKVNELIHLRMLTAAVRRGRQAFGRGIRAAEDSFTFWITDPRMPRSDLANAYEPSMSNKPWNVAARGLVRIIPERFRRFGSDSAWANGDLLSAKGKRITARDMEEAVDGSLF